MYALNISTKESLPILGNVSYSRDLANLNEPTGILGLVFNAAIGQEKTVDALLVVKVEKNGDSTTLTETVTIKDDLPGIPPSFPFPVQSETLTGVEADIALAVSKLQPEGATFEVVLTIKKVV